MHPAGFRRASSSSDDEPGHPRPNPAAGEARPYGRPNPTRVKRALFGPTDHEENLRYEQSYCLDCNGLSSTGMYGLDR